MAEVTTLSRSTSFSLLTGRVLVDTEKNPTLLHVPQELRALKLATPATTQPDSLNARPAQPVLPPPPPKKTKKKKAIVRKMPDHILPPYVEANFRTMMFIMTRPPKVSDFPQEQVYRPEALDLLFRHYYRNKTS